MFKLPFHTFQIVASLYLVMVVVMVGLNYRLRGRGTSKSRTRNSEDATEDLEEAEAGLEPIPYRAASVCFTEAKGSFSSLVSAETWAPATTAPPRPPARLVQV